MSNALIAAKNTAAAHLATKSTDELFEMYELADCATVAAWIADAIEARHPHVSEAMNNWADDLETNDSYIQALKKAVAA